MNKDKSVEMQIMESSDVSSAADEGVCPGSPWPSSADSATTDCTKPEVDDAVVEQPSDKRKIFKIIVVGDTNVGKTCLTYRFCSGKFPEKTEATIGVDFREKWLDVGGEFIKLQIWDTAGQERFRRSMVQHYYRNVHAIVYVYDISRISSFENLPQWLAECEEHGLDMSVPRILVGNKCDIQSSGLSSVPTSMAQRFADSYGMPLFETSAKDNAECDHVESIFLTIAHKLKNSKSLIIQASTEESSSIMLSRADHRPPYSPPTTDYCLC